jgi:hypothetical protein
MTKTSPNATPAARRFESPVQSPSSQQRRRPLRQRQATPRQYEETSSCTHISSFRRFAAPVSLGGLLIVYSVISNYSFTMQMLQQQQSSFLDRPLSLATDEFYYRDHHTQRSLATDEFYHHTNHTQSQSQSESQSQRPQRLWNATTTSTHEKNAHEFHPAAATVQALTAEKNAHEFHPAAATVHTSASPMCSACRTVLALRCHSKQSADTMSLSNLILDAEKNAKTAWNVTLDCSSCELAAHECPEAIKHRTSAHITTSAASSTASRKPKKDTKNATTATVPSMIGLDDAAPTIRFGVTHFLQSVPARYRLPVRDHPNLTAYFADRDHVYPQAEYFFEYNPSIVSLPVSYQQQLQGLFKTTNTTTTASSSDNTPHYLASYRVTSTQQCVTDDLELTMIGGSWPRPQSKNWLGLALLNANLEIVWDLATDIGAQVRNHRIEDFRLFLLHNQIYVSSFQLVFPLWLVATNETRQIPCYDCMPLAPVDGGNTNTNTPKVTAWVRPWPSCSADTHTRRTGKNLNYFVDGHNRTVLEKFPLGRKELINLDLRCRKDISEDALNVTNDPRLPKPSFATTPKNHSLNKVLTRERGSACCVEIPDPRQQRLSNVNASLLLGISHSKTKYNGRATRNNLTGNLSANNFFSSFYAMEAIEPYTVVARSGMFCLGFSPAQEAVQGQNPYAHMNHNPLIIDKAFDCPRIHFVSGMVEKFDDPSQIILAYGINDCVPRMVQVAKSDIVSMLFQGQIVQKARI